MSTSLMNLTSEYLALLELAKDPEVDEQTLIDTMEAISGEINTKVGGYMAVCNHLESRADMFDAEAERLTKGSKALRNNVKRIKDRLKEAMIAMNKNSIECDYGTAKVQKNGGLQPLKITGEVPNNYKKVILENDNEKIRNDLKAGVALDFAHLEERGTHLRFY